MIIIFKNVLINDLALICVGQIKSPNIRIDLNNLIKNNISLATLKSKHSIVSNNAKSDPEVLLCIMLL